MIHVPLIKLQCSPTPDGAGAAVIVSERSFAVRPHIRSKAILMARQALLTDLPQLYSGSAIDLIGADMTERAAQAAMKEAGVTPKDVNLCKLHGCFSADEIC